MGAREWALENGVSIRMIGVPTHPRKSITGRRADISRAIAVVMTVVALAWLLLLTPRRAEACGFYVPEQKEGRAAHEGALFNDATRVVVMRAGMRTVLSLQNDYRGPPENFALVIPVPAVLERENVRTLPLGLFDRIDALSSPRLVELWERDPCWYEHIGRQNAEQKEGGTSSRALGEEQSPSDRGEKPLVNVAGEFKVAEYDVVILSAEDSGALETWLRANKYVIPVGAEPLLRPYVQAGSKFLVARVDAKRLRFHWGRAALSPLRVHFDSPNFTLPIRLGLINSSGVQDLIVHILAADRYEAANYENLFIPTNLDVTNDTKRQFDAFYAALFDRTVKGHPHAVVTEYAWAADACDSCPKGVKELRDEDLRLFGADVAPAPTPKTMILTRLHARYGKDSAGDDLAFKIAAPIVGGRERDTDAEGNSSHDAHPSPNTPNPGDPKSASNDSSTFQARYVVRHLSDPDMGPNCEAPQYGRWESQPSFGEAPPPPRARPPTTKALAARNVDMSKLLIDEAAARALRRYGSYPSSFDRLSDRLGETNTGIAAFLAGFVIVGFVAFGRTLRSKDQLPKLSAPKSIGWFVALAVLMLVVSAFALVRMGLESNRLSPLSSTRLDLIVRDVFKPMWTIAPVVGGVLGAAAVALRLGSLPSPSSTDREESRGGAAWLVAMTLAPAVFGSVDALWKIHRAKATLESEVYPTADPALWGRIMMDLAGEIVEPISIGCVRSGLLLVLVSWLLRPCTLVVGSARPGTQALRAHRLNIGIAFGVAMLVRVLLTHPHFQVLDALALVAMLSAMMVIVIVMSTTTTASSKALPLMVAVTGPLLFDFGARLRAMSIPLSETALEYMRDRDARTLPFLQWFVHEERLRPVLIAVDMLVLVAVMVVIRRRRDSSRPAKPSSFAGENGSTKLAIAAVAFVLLLGPTAFAWTGRTRSLALIGRATAHLTWIDEDDAAKASMPVRPLSANDEHEVPPSLFGPAVLVNQTKQLFVTPSAGLSPSLYTPSTPGSETIEQALAGSTEPSLLVAPADMSFGDVVSALSPYSRFAGGSPGPFGGALPWHLVAVKHRDDAIRTSFETYLPLLRVHELDPIPIEVSEAIQVGSPRRSPDARDGTGFLYDADTDSLDVIDIRFDGDGYFAVKTELPKNMGPFRVEDANTSDVREHVANRNEVALVGFAPSTKMEDVYRAASAILSMRANRTRQIFQRVVLVPDRAALPKL
jgi:hypothetical protein